MLITLSCLLGLYYDPYHSEDVKLSFCKKNHSERSRILGCLVSTFSSKLGKNSYNPEKFRTYLSVCVRVASLRVIFRPATSSSALRWSGSVELLASPSCCRGLTTGLWPQLQVQRSFLQCFHVFSVNLLVRTYIPAIVICNLLLLLHTFPQFLALR